jgi:hypothetical protein
MICIRTKYGVSIVSDGWTNVKGKTLINVLGVSASGAVFLSAHDYLDHYKTSINIAEPLIKTIQEIGLYNVIQVITDNVANCKAAREQSLRICILTYFGLGVWCTH